MEQAPTMRPEYPHKGPAVMPPINSTLPLIGIILFLWLAIFGFLVMTITWVLVNLRDIKTQKAWDLNLKEL